MFSSPEKKANATPTTSPAWHYLLDINMDGKTRGWHPHDQQASARLEAAFLTADREQSSRTTWHLQSGYFSYEVDVNAMKQRNMETGTVRPIRRVLPEPSILSEKVKKERAVKGAGSSRLIKRKIRSSPLRSFPKRRMALVRELIF